MDSSLKWHGGKHYLTKPLVELTRSTAHKHRVEVFGGSLAYTLANDPEGVSEVVNDLNGLLMNFWNVIADDVQFDLFKRRCQATPFAEPVWNRCAAACAGVSTREAVSICPDGFAWAFFVMVRQSMAGRQTNFAPLSKRRVRRGMNEQASAWLTSIDGLQMVHGRMNRVAVRCTTFHKLIKSEDREETLFYADPTYVHSTRSTTEEYGPREMTDADHRLLLTDLSQIKGKFLLSGYRCDLYDQFAAKFGWLRRDFELPNNAASGAEKERKIESVWSNF